MYSIKVKKDYDGTALEANKEVKDYLGAGAGAFGFADETGTTLISRSSFSTEQSQVDAGINGANALLQDYAKAGSAGPEIHQE